MRWKKKKEKEEGKQSCLFGVRSVFVRQYRLGMSFFGIPSFFAVETTLHTLSNGKHNSYKVNCATLPLITDARYIYT